MLHADLLEQARTLEPQITALRRAIHAEPMRHEAYLGMARVLPMLGQAELGEQAFADALQQLAHSQPESERAVKLAEAAHRMGQYRLEQGDAVGAVRALQRGLLALGEVPGDAPDEPLLDLRAEVQMDLG